MGNLDGVGCDTGAIRDTALFVVMSVADGHLVLVVADHETQASGVDVAMAPEEESTEDGLGHDVENTVEDGLGVGRDNVATLG